MEAQNTMQNWENLVKKQLKTEEIYAELQKENLEGVTVKPYYTFADQEVRSLPRVEESTVLVSDYHESLEQDVFAFLLNENVEGLDEKSIFINNKDLAEHLSPEDSDRYFSLIDVFDEKNASFDEQLAKEMLAKDFTRKVCVDISLHQNAGASIVQQLAGALAKTKELFEFFGAEVLPRIIFRIAVGHNYFFEIAKIRALKLLVQQLGRELGVDTVPYIFAETTLRNKTISDPENNLIRSTLELSAAMIGGADAVYSNDYRMNGGSTLSKEISFKQQIVLAYESIINVFDDAGSGSYLIEDLTDQFAGLAWKFFLEIEEQGGYIDMLKSGKLQQMIYEHAVAEQNWVEEGRIKLIGANLYPQLEKVQSAENLYSASEIIPVRWSEMYEK